MSMKKHIIWMLAAVVVVATGCGRRPEQTVSELADRFFRLVGESRLEEAYGLLAEESRQETSPEDFAAAIEALGLAGHQGVAWSAPDVDDDYGRIEGALTTRTGEIIRQEVVCFRKGGTWAIHMVREAPDPAAAERHAEMLAAMPDATGMVRLAAGAMAGLAEALERDDFAAFHQELAPVLRDQLSVAQLQEAFGWLADEEIGLDWGAVRAATPILDPSSGLNDGILTLTGRVPAAGKDVGFQLQFMHGDGVWRLIAINVRPPLGAQEDE
jgi:hypothetical protein